MLNFGSIIDRRSMNLVYRSHLLSPVYWTLRTWFFQTSADFCYVYLPSSASALPCDRRRRLLLWHCWSQSSGPGTGFNMQNVSHDFHLTHRRSETTMWWEPSCCQPPLKVIHFWWRERWGPPRDRSPGKQDRSNGLEVCVRDSVCVRESRQTPSGFCFLTAGCRTSWF